MDLRKVLGGIFAIIFSIILFMIIRYALKIMYKDVKNGTKKTKTKRKRPMDKSDIDNPVRTGNTGITRKADVVDKLQRTGTTSRATGQIPPVGGNQAARPNVNRKPQEPRQAQPRPTQQRPAGRPPQRPIQQRPQNRFPSVEVLACKAGANIRIGSIIPVNRVITLGRRADNVIVLNDNFTSSYHAKLYLRNGEIILEDLNSTNGTFVNQRPIKGKVRLRVNDEIKLGGTIFRVIG